MKNLLIIALSIICLYPIAAQKVIEKTIDHKDRYVELKVPFASNIEVKTWDKSTVYFKADIETEEGKYLDLYQLDVMEGSGAITIVSEPKAIFKEFQKEWKSKNEGKKKKYYSWNNEYEFNYVLYVPKNSEFRISSINGDMKSETIEGDFTADLINGNIDIQTYRGNLDLSTINGEIDLKVSDASLVAETINGDIYADEKLKLTTYDKHVGQKVEKRVSNASKKLKLNTINGNMYLRL